MNKVQVLECPNCRGTDFAEIGTNKQQCAFCGTVLRLRESRRRSVACRRCGSENERGAWYCTNCGQSLVSWTPVRARKWDPAVTSMISTGFCVLVMPVVGGLVGSGIGLRLAYKALGDAQATAEASGSEKLARTAVVVGWIGMAYSLATLCIFTGSLGLPVLGALCEGLFEMLGQP